MREHCEIALATTTGGLPHVRIVNFYYVPEEHRVCFATFKDNEKIVELSANQNTAFTTVLNNGTMEHVRASGRAVKSTRSIYDIADAFTAKCPHYQEIIDNAGDDLILYEITLTEAIVSLKAGHKERVLL